jgi:hypothetical protein
MRLPRYFSKALPQTDQITPEQAAAGAKAGPEALAAISGAAGEFAFKLYETQEATKAQDLLAQKAREAAELKAMEGDEEALASAAAEFGNNLSADEIGMRSIRNDTQRRLDDLGVEVGLDIAGRIRKQQIVRNQTGLLNATTNFIAAGQWDQAEAVWQTQAAEMSFTPEQVASQRARLSGLRIKGEAAELAADTRDAALLAEDDQIIRDQMAAVSESDAPANVKESQMNALQQTLVEFNQIRKAALQEQEAGLYSTYADHRVAAEQNAISEGLIDSTTYSVDPLANEQRKLTLRLNLLTAKAKGAVRGDALKRYQEGETLYTAADKKAIDEWARESTKGMEPAEQDMFITGIARQQGWIPPSYQADFKRGATMADAGDLSGNTIDMVKRYTVLTDRENGAPGVVDGLTGDERSFYTEAARLYRSGEPPESAAAKAWTSVYGVTPEDKTARAYRYDEEGVDKVKQSAQNLYGQLPGQPFFGKFGRTDMEGSDVYGEYLRTHEQAYNRTGSWESAQAEANDYILRNFSVSTVNGEQELLRGGPTQGQESDRWRDQLNSELEGREFRFKREDGTMAQRETVNPDDVRLVSYPVAGQAEPEMRMQYNGFWLQNPDTMKLETFRYSQPLSEASELLEDLEKQSRSLEFETGFQQQVMDRMYPDGEEELPYWRARQFQSQSDQEADLAQLDSVRGKVAELRGRIEELGRAD